MSETEYMFFMGLLLGWTMRAAIAYWFGDNWLTKKG